MKLQEGNKPKAADYTRPLRIGKKRGRTIRAVERCTFAPSHSKKDNMVKDPIKSVFFFFEEAVVPFHPNHKRSLIKCIHMDLSPSTKGWPMRVLEGRAMTPLGGFDVLKKLQHMYVLDYQLTQKHKLMNESKFNIILTL